MLRHASIYSKLNIFFSFMILVYVFIIIEFIRCQYAYATLTLGFRIQITDKVTSARKVLEFTDLTFFFSTYNNFVAVGSTFIVWLFFFSEALLARRNASVVVLWKHTMVSAGLSLFGVAVGIGNIVVGADSDDGRWHLSGGSLVPAILVSHILKRFAIHMVNCPSVLDTFFVSQKWDSNLQFPSVKQIKEDVNQHSLVATI